MQPTGAGILSFQGERAIHTRHSGWDPCSCPSKGAHERHWFPANDYKLGAAFRHHVQRSVRYTELSPDRFPWAGSTPAQLSGVIFIDTEPRLGLARHRRSLNLRSQGVRWTGPRFRPVRHNDSRGPRQNGAEHQRLGERDRPEVGRR
jgi:hypothetical protein